MEKYIVILGRKLEQDGAISEIYKERLDKAAELYFENLDANNYSKLIISGGDVSKTGKSEAQAGLEYLIEKINPKRVMLERKALDTIGNAIYSKEILIGKSNNNPIIVSSSYHIPRVKFIFDFILGDDFNIEYAGARNNMSSEELKYHEKNEEEKFKATIRFFEGQEFRKGDHKSVLRYFEKREGFLIRDYS